MTQPLTASPSARLSGRVTVPGDKSISHRAVILGALATGRTRIEGLLDAEDVLATARAVAALGASVVRSNGALEVTGQGVGGLRAPKGPLDFGNSGTGSRLMLGVIAGHDMGVELTGDASLRRRPMGRVLQPLDGDGPRCGRRRGACHAASEGARHRRSASHYLRPARAVSASKVRGAPCRTARARPHHGDREPPHARPYRTHAQVLRGRGCGRRSGWRGKCDHDRWRRRAPRRARDCAGRPELGRVSDRRRADLPGLGHRRGERAAQSDASGVHRDVARDGR